MNQQSAQGLPNEAASNWNMLASSLLVAVWRRLGISAYFVSPGYRDAPLIAALQARRDVDIISCFDERAGAYQALGYAKATGRPAVLICTSGTAGANYFPAVMEASVEQVPLLIVTADRPFELVQAAAQQVLDQRQIYGRFVKKSLDFPAPVPGLDGRAWMDIARDLLQVSVSAPAGPVHLNLPFHLPLDPVKTADGPGDTLRWDEELLKMPARIWVRERPAMDENTAAAFCATVQAAEKGLLIIGRLSSEGDRKAARLIEERLAWPTFADVGSGLKGSCAHEILDLGHPLMREALSEYRPDTVIHIGRRLVSRHFDDFIARLPPRAYWVITSEGGPQDPTHLTQREQIDVQLSSVAAQLDGIQALPRVPALKEVAHYLRSELRGFKHEDFNFAGVAEAIISLSPPHTHGLFLGNSTAIRAFDSWCYKAGPWPEIQANRGVSGIEGSLATALGIARASDKTWTVVLGDISMMHDLNSLLSLKTSAPTKPLIVVIVNNGGGRIFETLPIAAYPSVKDPWISTPHSFTFEGLAQMAGVDYLSAQNQNDFNEAYAHAVKMRRTLVIECQQRPEADRLYQDHLRQLDKSSRRL